MLLSIEQAIVSLADIITLSYFCSFNQTINLLPREGARYAVPVSVVLV